MLRNVGRWDRSNIVDGQIHVIRGLLVLLRLGLVLLLEDRSDCRKDGLELCLEGLLVFLGLILVLLLEGSSDRRKDGLQLS